MFCIIVTRKGEVAPVELLRHLTSKGVVFERECWDGEGPVCPLCGQGDRVGVSERKGGCYCGHCARQLWWRLIGESLIATSTDDPATRRPL